MTFAEVMANARRARKATGKPVIAQLSDIVKLRMGPQKLMADEYFDLRLFEPRLSWSERAQFLGKWTEEDVFRILDEDDRSRAKDKLSLYRTLVEADLPHPRMLAIFDPQETFPKARQLGSAVALASWLRTEAAYPLFSKPARGGGGKHAYLIERADGDHLVFGDGTRHAIQDFANAHDPVARGPLLFQEVMRPHPKVAELTGGRLATARMQVIFDRDEPDLWRASVRIPTGDNMVDTFHGGRFGNLIVRLDLETGAFVETLGLVQIERQRVEVHPDTGQALDGFVLPDWNEAIALLKAGHMLFRKLKFAGWDMAFTDRGPMLVECNPRGSYLQYAGWPGMATPRFRALYPDGRI
ncbi:MAG: sugar-transfer associated ATP-grasp domain-containing protein [Pacificimonas sp.]